MEIKNVSLQDPCCHFLLSLAGEGLPEYLWTSLAEEGQSNRRGCGQNGKRGGWSRYLLLRSREAITAVTGSR